MYKLAVVLLILVTSACGLLPPREPVTVKELLPVGSTLRLTQALEIPADRLYVYIQYGKLAPFRAYNSVNIYYPYCMLRMRKSSPQPRQVMPDRFLVTRVVEYEDYVGQAGIVQLASAELADARISGSIGIGLGVDSGGGPSMIMYATIMSLHSNQQPEVKELVCGHWEDYGTVEPLTLEEMKSALGELIVIE